MTKTAENGESIKSDFYDNIETQKRGETNDRPRVARFGSGKQQSN